MAAKMETQLDLALAYQRMKKDRADRPFARHPFVFDWIETDLKSWLEGVQGKLAREYHPKPALLCRAPRGNWLVRPISVLHPEDELVYNALVGKLLQVVIPAVGWARGDPVVQPQLANRADKREWVTYWWDSFKQWRDVTIERMKRGAQFVVQADISAFYDTMDIRRLTSELAALGADSDVLDLLAEYLRKWSQPRERGVPQGFSASDILAHVYLVNLDRGFRDAGFDHLRYNDDIRVFCKGSLDARKALLKLDDLLRDRGLNIQTAKTRIDRADAVLQQLSGIKLLLTQIDRQLRQDLEAFVRTEGYPRVFQIREVFEENPEAPPLLVLEKAFKDYFAEVREGNFDPTLFHYLLNRLGVTGSRVAVDYGLDLLVARPEETTAILRYFRQVGLEEDEQETLATHTTSEDAIYDAQTYEILKWFFEVGQFPESLVLASRNFAWDRNRPNG